MTDASAWAVGQLRNAPPDAVFVCKHDYPASVRGLARSLGRPDIRVLGASEVWLVGSIGRPVVYAHADRPA